MKAVIIKFWQDLQPRERMILSFGVVFGCCFIFYVFIWQPWHAAIDHMEEVLPYKRVDLIWMRQQSEIILNGGVTQVSKTKGENQSLMAIIDQTAKASGVRKTIQQMVPQQDKQEVSVVLEETSFNKWLQWVDVLKNDYAVSIKQLSAERDTKLADTAEIRVTFIR